MPLRAYSPNMIRIHCIHSPRYGALCIFAPRRSSAPPPPACPLFPSASASHTALHAPHPIPAPPAPPPLLSASASAGGRQTTSLRRAWAMPTPPRASRRPLPLPLPRPCALRPSAPTPFQQHGPAQGPASPPLPPPTTLSLPFRPPLPLPPLLRIAPARHRRMRRRARACLVRAERATTRPGRNLQPATGRARAQHGGAPPENRPKNPCRPRTATEGRRLGAAPSLLSSPAPRHFPPPPPPLHHHGHAHPHPHARRSGGHGHARRCAGGIRARPRRAARAASAAARGRG